MRELGVMLPIRIETRLKNNDLWIRVVPDEPWFLRDDPRISPDELSALKRYVAAAGETAPDGVPPAWRVFASEVGGARAVYLHRQFVVGGSVRDPNEDEQRTEAPMPRIANFPTELRVWVSEQNGAVRQVLQLAVNRDRLLADFADTDAASDRRWWEDWNESVAIGMAGIVPGNQLSGQIEALYVTGLSDTNPADHFAALSAEGRLGLLAPGMPTNTVAGEPAAPLGNDADTWWRILTTSPGEADADVSRALTGDPGKLGNLPGGDQPHRAPSQSLVRALWPALWGYAAADVFALSDGRAPVEWARWTATAMYPEGAFPALRIGPQPYGLLPVTRWLDWFPGSEEPEFETPLKNAAKQLQDKHVAAARGRGTVADKTTDELLDLIADTPTSRQFRYRAAWPLELWHLSRTGSGGNDSYRSLFDSWLFRHGIGLQIGVMPTRRYGARGRPRRVGLPLVLPPGVQHGQFADRLGVLAQLALSQPSLFANTQQLEAVHVGRCDSLLIRLVIRSLQLLIGDTERERAGVTALDPEPLVRNNNVKGQLQQRIEAAQPVENPAPGSAAQHLTEVAAALQQLARIESVPDLERRLAATIDCSSHRIDPWLLALPQRRLDAGRDRRRLGAYGWVDWPLTGSPGPTPAGLVAAPSTAGAMAAAVLRDRAISDTEGRWDLDITSRRARTAERISAQVRTGSHLTEALGREVERIVGAGPKVEQLRRDFPVRTEHAGRRVCDGLRVLQQGTFPVVVNADQQARLQDLRDGIDAYGDLLVADGVHHLVEGRPQVAGAVMEAAAGLARPPELALLRTPREGRAVSTSVVLVLAHVASTALPSGDAARASLSPATTLDPSVAGFLTDVLGAPSTWSYQVDVAGTQADIKLDQLGLMPADALALTRDQLEALAATRAAQVAGKPADQARVIGGIARARYERAAELIGVIGRDPVTGRALAETPEIGASGTDGEAGVSASLLARYVATRQVCAALVRRLQTQSFDAQLRTAVARWGVVTSDAAVARQRLEARLAAAPDESAAAGLDRAAFLDAAAALVSPTGQVGITDVVPADKLPEVQAAGTLDAVWLPVVAAVRPALARLEAQQLASQPPLKPWVNRSDIWQTNPEDPRRLLVTYAATKLNVATLPDTATVAVGALDRFSEVIPAAEQTIGAAFGFDAPAARAQQAILLAVPPTLDGPLDHDLLPGILVDTRRLAHSRMARPAELDDEFHAFASTGLLPATGAVAIRLEA